MPKVSDAHRAARREQIMEAAWRCVAREGFHKTTMADVIGESGLSAGAVYGYFRSKNELIKVLAEVAIGRVARRLEELSREPSVTPTQALQVALDQVVSMAEAEEGDFTRVGVQAWGEALRDPEIHAIFAERMGSVRSGYERVLRRSQRDGVLSADADPAQMAQVMTGLVPGFILQRLILSDVTAESYLAGFGGLFGR